MKTIAMAAILAVPLAGCSAVSSALDGVGLAQQGAQMANGCAGVNKTNYNRIQIGMTLTQVQSTLDCQGEEENTYAGGFSQVFAGKNNTFIFGGFGGGKLTYKSKNGF